MTLYDELVARGLIAQVTDEDRIKELINNGKATFYRIRSNGGFASRGSFHGTYTDEEITAWWQPSNRTCWWRYSDDW